MHCIAQLIKLPIIKLSETFSQRAGGCFILTLPKFDHLRRNFPSWNNFKKISAKNCHQFPRIMFKKVFSL